MWHPRLVLLATSLSLAASAVASTPPGVVKLPLERRQVPSHKHWNKRANDQPVTLDNELTLYIINVSIGEPAQQLSLQLDTGSSDLWVFSPQACNDHCVGGTFDIKSSSSADIVGANDFVITYATANSYVNGSYFTDKLSFGSFTLHNQTMAVADAANAVSVGIMGLGLTTEEAIYAESHETETYPTVIDTLKSQGLINERVFSLYLDDVDASTGSVLFGGYDADKYEGELTILDLQPSDDSGTIDSYSVAWSFFGFTLPNGTTYDLTSSNLPAAAVLDSGTSLQAVPAEIFDALGGYFNVASDAELGYVLDCDAAKGNGTLDYGFGGKGGPIITVPWSEIALEVTDENGQPLTSLDGTKICVFGLSPAIPGVPFLLGDTFLRSAYVLYNLDKKQVAIANANWASSGSNIVAVGSNNQGLASSSSAVAVTVTQTASGVVAPTIMQSTVMSESVVTQSATLSHDSFLLSTSHIFGATTKLSSVAGHGSQAPTGEASNTAAGSSASPTKGAAASLVPSSGGYLGLGLWCSFFFATFIGNLFMRVI